jgi:cobyrinic acid a,c-diamide synthase
VTARILIAGTHSGAGKTTVATGLMAALTAAGHTVAGFKVGPDFIDPSYHAVATGRPPRNLDAFLTGPDLVAPLFAHGAAGADVAVVEGVMGLFDGAGTGETASTAHVAKLLDAPVVLVVDAAGMARSIAAVVHGYTTFDPAVRVAGVVANRVGSGRHVELLREAVRPLGLPLLGALPRDDALVTPSRHLGLIPAAERAADARRSVTALGEQIAAHVDLAAVVALARSAPPLQSEPWQPPRHEHHRRRRVAVAAGPAFSFTYTEHLELLAAAGAEVARFDPTSDVLPDGADALYLPGGFPEAHADALAANAPLRAAIAAFARNGRPVLGECGGLLYLCRSLDGQPMCGVVEADARMSPTLTLGYRSAEAAATSTAWRAGERSRGHEFHHTVIEERAAATPAWRFDDGRVEGFVTGAVHASFLHTHWAATPSVAQRLVAA